MPESFQIAIDGPVAVGKSTIARILAQRLGFLYVDTGAMYRATGLLALREGVDVEDGEAVATLLRTHNITLATPQGQQNDGRKITVYLDDEDVSWEIRTEKVSTASSKVSQHAVVRQQLVPLQQEIASKQNVVMEGRDITFRVLPDAQLKIFLTASEEKRAGWRHQEVMARGEDISLEQIKKDLKERDDRDMNRDVDPLHVTDDAWMFDRSDFTLDEAIDEIETRARKLWHKNET
ncbi:(d)CMP kinase [Candidatus Woesebacteria bacterium]|nr:(d)CMP kinase [Candidatus Woesebacteria bacterium]MCD8507665.1 (d)CMP kinase [Candidatus Woesebacteria bacterium]MCD8526752.1 (d)CMP kinase [Candidatus Woesebacteria bacterium]MCD8546505.1 (d)CMP kinase [Candidatus Woesebacteria bacterium]